MEEETYMSQENKKFFVHLERINNQDFMVFNFDQQIKVCMTDESGQDDLKRVFSTLLTEIIECPVMIEYVEKAPYKTGLYIDVCKEYLNDLNRELLNVRENIPKKLKTKTIIK